MSAMAGGRRFSPPAVPLIGTAFLPRLWCRHILDRNRSRHGGAGSGCERGLRKTQVLTRPVTQASRLVASTLDLRVGKESDVGSG